VFDTSTILILLGLTAAIILGFTAGYFAALGLPKNNIWLGLWRKKVLLIRDWTIKGGFVEITLRNDKRLCFLKEALKNPPDTIPPDADAVVVIKEKVASLNKYKKVKRFELVRYEELRRVKKKGKNEAREELE